MKIVSGWWKTAKTFDGRASATLSSKLKYQKISVCTKLRLFSSWNLRREYVLFFLHFRQHLPWCSTAERFSAKHFLSYCSNTGGRYHPLVKNTKPKLQTARAALWSSQVRKMLYSKTAIHGTHSTLSFARARFIPPIDGVSKKRNRFAEDRR